MIVRKIFKSFNPSVIRNVINVSGTKANVDYEPPENLLFWDKSRYHSIYGSDNYVRFDFLYDIPYIHGFKLKSSNNRDPYHWVLEGSKDGENFTELYTNDGEKLCDTWGKFDGGTIGCMSDEVKSFIIEKKGAYKSLKLRQTGKDSNNEKYLVLSSVEFIGILFSHRRTCQHKQHVMCNLCFITLICSY